MFIETQRKRLSFLFLSLVMLLLSLPVLAKTEYVIGLTTQGIRSASVEELELGFNYQLEGLSKNKDYLMKIKVYPSNDLLKQSLYDRKSMAYFGPPLLFIQNMNDFNPNLLFTPVLSNSAMQRYVLLVRKDAAITQLEKLKNTSLGYCETDEVGIFYLQKLLKDKKMGAVDNYFSKMLIKKNPSLAISAVFFKESQATIVLESDFNVAAELNPQLKKQLVAIETSPGYITNLFAARKDLEGPMTEAELEANMSIIGSNIQSKKLLKSYNYGAMRKIKLEDLNSVRDLINSLKDDKGQNK